MLAALGEGKLIAAANVLVRDGSKPVPFRQYVDTGLQPVPAKLWAGYPWPWFELRAVRRRGKSQYRERTPDGRDIGPVFANPTVATRDVDRWLGVANDRYQAPLSSSPATPAAGRRGRKQGSGVLDDDVALQKMLSYLAVNEAPSRFAAAAKAVPLAAKGASSEATQRRLASKFRDRFGAEPPPEKTWADVEDELNSKSEPK